MEYKQLNNGMKIPLLGFGVFQMGEEACEEAVVQALNTGYRLIDTAAVYANEAAVGRGIKRSGVPRDELFLTSKLWISDASYEGAKAAFQRSIRLLEVDYLDLFLIHQPYGDYYGAWRALSELYMAGKIKSIGVSNFSTGRLTDFVLNHEVKPAINQVEQHPYRQQALLRETADYYDVAIEAWSPFNQGKDHLFTDPTLESIAKTHHKSVPQVILRWQTQMGIITIPKSVHLERLQENFAIFDFQLSAEELALIAALDQAPQATGPREPRELVERLLTITI